MFIRLGSNAIKVGAAVSGIVGYFLLSDERKSVYAWSTNSTSPSVPWDWNWDKREPSFLINPKKSKKENNDNQDSLQSEEKVVEKPVASRYLIFIRHGQYNLEGASDQERYLTDLGRQQAHLTGKRLKHLAWNYTRFVHSTMTRAAETANVILAELPDMKDVEKCDLLREGAPIPPEPGIGSWKAQFHFFIDGSRIEAAFRKYFHRASVSQKEDSYEIFVCHANVIRYFACRALQFPPEAWLRMSLHNGSITCFVIRPDGRVSLKMLGDCGYMPPDKLTFN